MRIRIGLVDVPHVLAVEERGLGADMNEAFDVGGARDANELVRAIMGISQRIHVLDGGKTIAEDTPDMIRQHEGVLAAYLGMEG